MRVVNLHKTLLDTDGETAARLIDQLSSQDDRLWPRDVWPEMRFDKGLMVGAEGGHGPVRYCVESYVPGRRVRFRFSAPRGFEGHHGFNLVRLDANRILLRHVLVMRAGGIANLTWPLVYRPLHDALIEDAMTRAERQVGMLFRVRTWSPYVRLLRWILSGGRARAQAKSGSREGRPADARS